MIWKRDQSHVADCSPSRRAVDRDAGFAYRLKDKDDDCDIEAQLQLICAQQEKLFSTNCVRVLNDTCEPWYLCVCG